MLNSFMKHKVLVLCGLAEIGLDYFFLIIPTRLMDYNIFCQRLHSTVHILERARTVYSRLAFPMHQ